MVVPETNMTAMPPDTATNWTTVVVPAMWKPGVSNGVWLSRTFRLPENLAGRRIFLRALGAYVGKRSGDILTKASTVLSVRWTNSKF